MRSMLRIWQERGEVAKLGSNQTEVGVPGENTLATVADIGLTRKGIHEARAVRARGWDPSIPEFSGIEVARTSREVGDNRTIKRPPYGGR